MKERTNQAMRKAIDTAISGCGTSQEKEALLFGVRLAIELLKATEAELEEVIND